MNQHQKTIEELFRQNPPRTSAEASVMIEKLTGIKRSPTQVRTFMPKIGLKTLKIGYVPGKATEPDKINESYINSESVCELLDKLAALALTIPITLILDNARYQKCHKVRDHAKQLGIELLYLPS